MNVKAEARELITLMVDGIVLRGTYHRPRSRAGDSDVQASNVAVVFLNSLSSPRSLIGDSAVYWAESFASEGFPCFRVDLPGLGDSEGDRPNDLIRFTNEGGYGKAAAAVVKQLAQSRNLSGVVLFGHCAGATTALYAASECKECTGLILMDPYFNLPKALTSSLRPELVNWARRSKIGAILRALYDRVREIPGTIGKGGLPANANFSLLTRCKRVAATGLPILILRAPQPPVAGGNTLKAGAFDYLAYVLGLATHARQFTVKAIAQTDHSFANQAGRLAVRRCAEVWLNDYFLDPSIDARPFEAQAFETQPLETQLRHVEEKNTVLLGAAVSAKLYPGE